MLKVGFKNLDGKPGSYMLELEPAFHLQPYRGRESLSIGVVTDSTAYLDENYARENDIKVVPLKVIFGKEAYREGVDITSDEFFKKLKESPELPTTSSPSLGEFLEAYEEMAAKYDDIISIHIASGISGTVEVARAAAYQLKNLSIEVVDSRFVSLAIGIMIDQLVKGIKAGRGLSDLLGELRRMIDNLKIYFIVDTLEYLHKGGRIGGAQAFLGTILKVKPILTLNGTIDAKEKVRGTGKAIARVLEIALADLNGRKTLLGVSHVHNLEGGLHLREKVAEAFNCEQDEIFFNETGPVIGTHTGPGLLAFGYLPKEVLA